jgi:hypothetical protein
MKRLHIEKDILNITQDIHILSNRVKLRLQPMLKASDPSSNTSSDQVDTKNICVKTLEKITVDLQVALQRLSLFDRSSGDPARMLKKVKKSMAKANIEFMRVEAPNADRQNLVNWYELNQMKLGYKQMSCTLEEFAAVGIATASLLETCDDDIRNGLMEIKKLSEQLESHDYEPSNIFARILREKEKYESVFKTIDDFVQEASERGQEQQQGQIPVDTGVDESLQLISQLNAFISCIGSKDSSQSLDLDHIRSLAKELLHALAPIEQASGSQMSLSLSAESAYPPDTQLQWIRFALKQRKALMFVIDSLVRQEARDVLFPDSFTTADERMHSGVQYV